MHLDEPPIHEIHSREARIVDPLFFAVHIAVWRTAVRIEPVTISADDFGFPVSVRRGIRRDSLLSI